jgi:hypothetical protein
MGTRGARFLGGDARPTKNDLDDLAALPRLVEAL